MQNEIVESERSGSDRMAYSGPLSGPLNKRSGAAGSRKSARFNLPSSSSASVSAADDDETYVEITLDVRDDSVAVHSVKTAAGGDVEDPEVTLLARTLEKKSSFGSAVIRNASSRIRQVSQELKRLASLSKRSGPVRVDRSKSAAAHALKGLKFISKTDGAHGWPAVEKRFGELAKDGSLPKSLFGQCIGKKKSKTIFFYIHF